MRLERALQMAPLMMAALGDCIGSLVAARRLPSTIAGPAGILLNGSMAGEVRLAAPARGARGAIPDWLVVGAELEIAVAARERQDWSRTSLGEEAGPEITRTDDAALALPRTLPDLAQHLAGRGLPPRSRPVAVPGRGAEAPVKIMRGGQASRGRVLGLDAERQPAAWSWLGEKCEDLHLSRLRRT